jgi:hypothetical protein
MPHGVAAGVTERELWKFAVAIATAILQSTDD